MQQTKLDHWLRRKFVHETQVYCNSLPQGVDARFRIDEAPAGQPASHRFRITPPDDDALLELVDWFRLEGITYAATIEDKSGPLAAWLGRPGRSATCEVAWIGLGVVGAVALLSYLPVSAIVEAVKSWLPF